MAGARGGSCGGLSPVLSGARAPWGRGCHSGPPGLSSLGVCLALSPGLSAPLPLTPTCPHLSKPQLLGTPEARHLHMNRWRFPEAILPTKNAHFSPKGSKSVGTTDSSKRPGLSCPQMWRWLAPPRGVPGSVRPGRKEPAGSQDSEVPRYPQDPQGGQEGPEGWGPLRKLPGADLRAVDEPQP